jgi:topoisomerase-4 subunit A
MAITEEKFQPAFLEDLVGDRFGRYSKYIIQDRAIPDVRDGLKPVQRRILYSMFEAGNTPDKPYRKSAKTVGDVMGNYHPHGDSSIYEGMVRMAQPWKMGHVLIDGHGNWGSIDDDPAAAMRYTEARLSSIAMELLRDIEKQTVKYRDNFDNTAKEPTVLPSRFPNLLVNGVSGISSGFATEIPPHNLREVINACIAWMDKPQLTAEDLMQYVKGPDFPTGGIIMGEEGIREAYRTGRGKIYVRAKAAIEELRVGKKQITITEIPYGVVKSRLVTAMETLRLDKKVEGIAEVRDESGRDGLRIVVELKKETDAEGILAYLYKKTDLQVTYNFNMVAIVDKHPKQLGIVPMIGAYVEHQKEIVTKRSEYDLLKARDRAHVVEGLIKALSILDEVIQTIRSSKNRGEAQDRLVSEYDFTERQADAILVLQLYRLTNLEIVSLEKEMSELQKTMNLLEGILASESKLLQVIKKELTEIRDRYGIDRRSELQSEVEEIKVNLEVMVAPEDVLVTLTQDGYIKRSSHLSFTRSGGDVEGMTLKENDVLRQVLEVNTLDTLLIFTQKGQYFALPVHSIPEFKFKDSGTAIVNVIPMTREDRIVAIIPVKSYETEQSLLFVTKRGQVKRTELKEYATNRSTAIAAAKLGNHDEVIQVLLSGLTKDQLTETEEVNLFSSGSNDDNGPSSRIKEILLVTKLGMSIRFREAEVSAMGRNTAGVRGIQLKEQDEVISALLVDSDEGELLTVTERAFAKRTLIADYPVQGRGGKGIHTFEFRSGRGIKPNGNELVGSLYVKQAFNYILISNQGEVWRSVTEDVPIEERRSPGKAVVHLEKDHSIRFVGISPSVQVTVPDSGPTAE